MSSVYGYIFAEDAGESEHEFNMMTGLMIPQENIYTDLQQENSRDRPMLIRMEQKIHPEDLIYIKNLSYLGENYEEILLHWETLTKKLKADVVMLNQPLLDTRRGKEFMETLVSDIVTEMLTFVSENEVSKNRKRFTEGYLAAKARGVQYGRPLSPLPENFAAVYACWKGGEINGSQAARECGMPLSTFRWRAAKYAQEQEQLTSTCN